MKWKQGGRYSIYYTTGSLTFLIPDSWWIEFLWAIFWNSISFSRWVHIATKHITHSYSQVKCLSLFWTDEELNGCCLSVKWIHILPLVQFIWLFGLVLTMLCRHFNENLQAVNQHWRHMCNASQQHLTCHWQLHENCRLQNRYPQHVAWFTSIVNGVKTSDLIFFGWVCFYASYL